MIDDHTVVREGLRRLIRTKFDAEFFDATTAREALIIFHAEQPNMLILDLRLAFGTSGMSVLDEVIQSSPKAKILVFTMHSERHYARSAIAAGASAFVSKSAPVHELLAAIEAVLHGSKVLNGRHLEVGEDIASPSTDALTTREKIIFELLGKGHSITQIASLIGVSYKTTANACGMIQSKLCVETTRDVIRLAVQINCRSIGSRPLDRFNRE